MEVKGQKAAICLLCYVWGTGLLWGLWPRVRGVSTWLFSLGSLHVAMSKTGKIRACTCGCLHCLPGAGGRKNKSCLISVFSDKQAQFHSFIRILALMISLVPSSQILPKSLPDFSLRSYTGHVPFSSSVLCVRLLHWDNKYPEIGGPIAGDLEGFKCRAGWD